MNLSPADYQAFAAATGADYPQTAADKAEMAPAVQRWKAQQAAQHKGDRGPSATAVALGVGGIAALAAGGLALHHHLVRQGVQPAVAAKVAATVEHDAAAQAAATPPPAGAANDGPAAPTTLGSRGRGVGQVQVRTREVPDGRGGTRIAHISERPAVLPGRSGPSGSLQGQLEDHYGNQGINSLTFPHAQELNDPALSYQEKMALLDHLEATANERIAADVPGIRAVIENRYRGNPARITVKPGDALPERPLPGVIYQQKYTDEYGNQRNATYVFNSKSGVLERADPVARLESFGFGDRPEGYGIKEQEGTSNTSRLAGKAMAEEDYYPSDDRPENFIMDRFGSNIPYERPDGKTVFVQYDPSVPRKERLDIKVLGRPAAWSDLYMKPPKPRLNEEAFLDADFGEAVPIHRMDRNRYIKGEGVGHWGYHLEGGQPLPSFDPNRPLSEMLSAKDMAVVRRATGAAQDLYGYERDVPSDPGRGTALAREASTWSVGQQPRWVENEAPIAPYMGIKRKELLQRMQAPFHDYTDVGVTRNRLEPDGTTRIAEGVVMQHPSIHKELAPSGNRIAGGRLAGLITDLVNRNQPVFDTVVKAASQSLARLHSGDPLGTLRAGNLQLARGQGLDPAAIAQALGGNLVPTAKERKIFRPSRADRISHAADGTITSMELVRQPDGSYARQPVARPIAPEAVGGSTYGSWGAQLLGGLASGRAPAMHVTEAWARSSDPADHQRLTEAYRPRVPGLVRQLGNVLEGVEPEARFGMVQEALSMAAQDFHRAVDWAGRTPGNEDLAAAAAPGRPRSITFEQFAWPYVRKAVTGMVMAEKSAGGGVAARYNVPRDVTLAMAEQAQREGRPFAEVLGDAVGGAASPFSAVLDLDSKVADLAGRGDESYVLADQLASRFTRQGALETPSAFGQLHQSLGTRSGDRYSDPTGAERGSYTMPITLNFATDLSDARVRGTDQEQNEMIATRMLPVDRRTMERMQEEGVDLEQGDPVQYWRDPKTGEEFDLFSDGRQPRSSPLRKALEKAGDGQREAPMSRMWENEFNALDQEKRSIGVRLQTVTDTLASAERQLAAGRITREEHSKIRASMAAETAAATVEKKRVEDAQQSLVDRHIALDRGRVPITQAVEQANRGGLIPGLDEAGRGIVLDVLPDGRVGVRSDIPMQVSSLDARTMPEGTAEKLDYFDADTLQNAEINGPAVSSFQPDAGDIDRAMAPAREDFSDLEDVWAEVRRLQEAGNLTPAALQHVKTNYDRIMRERTASNRMSDEEAAPALAELSRQRQARAERAAAQGNRWVARVPALGASWQRHPSAPFPGVRDGVDLGRAFATRAIEDAGSIRLYNNPQWSGDLPTPGVDYDAGLGSHDETPRSPYWYTVDAAGRRIYTPLRDGDARPATAAMEVEAGEPGYRVMGEPGRVAASRPLAVQIGGSVRVGGPRDAEGKKTWLELSGSGPLEQIATQRDSTVLGNVLRREQVMVNGTPRWVQSYTGESAPEPRLASGWAGSDRYGFYDADAGAAAGAVTEAPRDITLQAGMPPEQIAALDAFDAARTQGRWREGELPGGRGIELRQGLPTGDIPGLGRIGTAMSAPAQGFTSTLPERAGEAFATARVRRRLGF